MERIALCTVTREENCAAAVRPFPAPSSIRPLRNLYISSIHTKTHDTSWKDLQPSAIPSTLGDCFIGLACCCVEEFRPTLPSFWLMEALLHRRGHDMTTVLFFRTPRRMPIALFKGGTPPTGVGFFFSASFSMTCVFVCIFQLTK